jgi:hypothetical protein
MKPPTSALSLQGVNGINKITAHIPQFAFTFFAKSLGALLCNVELIYNSTI